VPATSGLGFRLKLSACHMRTVMSVLMTGYNVQVNFLAAQKDRFQAAPMCTQHTPILHLNLHSMMLQVNNLELLCKSNEGVERSDTKPTVKLLRVHALTTYSLIFSW
jgi:hypothetical protein